MTTRIVFVGHSAALSGAELFLAGMLSRIRTLDPQVLLLEDGPLVGRLASLGVPVEVCPAPARVGAVSQRGWEGATPPAPLATARDLGDCIRRLSGVLRTSGAGAVHTNSAKAHVVGSVAARASGLPVAMHVHERIDPGTYGRLNRGLLHTATAAARTVIVNSETTRASLWPHDRRRAHVVPCPVEVDTDEGPPTAGARPGRMSVAMVGRISAWKGQHEAIRALAAATGRGGSVQIDLHVYGAALFERDQVYGDQARALADRLGVSPRVQWHGHVDDVTAAMRRHDLVLHASTRPEPFGQVLLEAMAAGVPVLAADRGGPLELITHGTSGWLHRSGDVTSLADALLRLACDPTLRERLALAGRARAADFTYDEILPRWEHLLTATATATATATTTATPTGL